MLKQHIIAVSAVLVLTSCRPTGTGKAQETQEKGDSLVLLFTGDVLLDRGVRYQAERHGWDWLFAGVDSLFHTAHATIINLECPLTEVSTPLGKRFIFRADTCCASVLRRAGVTHATLANNHTNDQGFQGIRSTIDVLLRTGITPMGWGRTEEERLTPTLISRGDVTAALFCAVLFPLENWDANPDDAAPCQTNAFRLAQAIREYRTRHPKHCIICVLHWGVEFQPYAAPQQMHQKHVLVAAGADIIIGHHPHVIQPPHSGDPIPILYSIGNFVFDQHTPETCETEVVRLTLKPDTLRLETLPMQIRDCRPEPIP